MKRAILSFFFASAVSTAAAAPAEIIFEDDFQDGEADGWGGSGGDLRLTTYEGNVSLRLSANGTGVLALTTEGYVSITASAAFAAMNLSPGDVCIAEISADDGASWIPFLSLTDGQDDSVTMHRGELAVSQIDNLPRALIRLSVRARSAEATCWADAIRLTGTPSRKEAASGRRLLTRDALARPFGAPVDTAAFAPPDAALVPAATLQGIVTLGDVRVSTRLLADAFDYDSPATAGWKTLPPFSFAFLQDGSRLIPAERGPIASAHEYWEFVLEPGAVWDEPGDEGFTRASIPFSLQEKNANCLHNGVLTFLFKATGETSRAAIQIGSETCFYFKFDMWGDAAVAYRPGAVERATEIAADDRALRARRLPVKPISDLVARYPAASGFGSPSEVSPGNMTTFGVVFEGVLYDGGCGTRYGAYPFCAEISLPSYSTAKTLVAGIGLMRLERLYPGASRSIVADYVPDCLADGNWADVTFANALDMATGNYTSDANQVDEDAADFTRFVTELSHAAKISQACAMHKRRAAPGTKWVYHTTDTYILGTAMASFARARWGAATDMFDTLVAPVWNAVGISPAALVTRRTYDEVRQPFTGWGITFQRDDFARLGLFLGRGDGVAGGQTLIDPGMLSAALQRDPSAPGLPAGSEDLRYQHGMWAWNAAVALGCKGEVWIPFLAGYGGILVALLPNGMVYYRVSDGADIPWARGAAAANAIRPFCEA
ncbi:MAG: hypothetical protein JNL56_03210 [Alphaproteobacteria bacterium]|nr:hypothetical protein [Alphaproteobacteria bacterium]